MKKMMIAAALVCAAALANAAPVAWSKVASGDGDESVIAMDMNGALSAHLATAIFYGPGSIARDLAGRQAFFLCFAR